MKTFKHRVMSYEQVTYDERIDGSCSIEAGLDRWAAAGWELVTTYPSMGYAPGATTMFVFRHTEAL